jgi:acetyltransferase
MIPWMVAVHTARHVAAIPSWFLTKDGHWLYCRLIRPDDALRLLDLFDALSPEARRRRFHANVDHLPAATKLSYAHQLAGVDNRLTGGAVVAVDHHQGQERLVGVVRLGPVEQARAEVAVVVRDDFQGRGVGHALLQRLPALAQRMGAAQGVAVIEADNLPALRLFRRLPFPMTAQTAHAETTLTITLA